MARVMFLRTNLYQKKERGNNMKIQHQAPYKNMKKQKKRKRLANKNRQKSTWTGESQCSCGQPLNNPTPDCYSHMTKGY